MRHSISACVLAVLLSACASAPGETDAGSGATATSSAGSGASAAGAGSPGAAQASAAAAGGSPAAAGAPAAPTGPAAPAGPPSAHAAADFNRALGFMRGNNATEAELEFKQMTLAYPQLSAPYVNLGILYRKAGHLDQSESALKSAVERNGASAIAWNELGATQRLRGEFADAAVSYERAIAADSNYAAAYRNLGVVSDLYLGDPERALAAFERYKELTGEDRPVTSWIAELRQRLGRPAVKPTAAPSAEAPATGTGAPATPAAAAKPTTGDGGSPGAPAGGSAAPPPKGGG